MTPGFITVKQQILSNTPAVLYFADFSDKSGNGAGDFSHTAEYSLARLRLNEIAPLVKPAIALQNPQQNSRQLLNKFLSQICVFAPQEGNRHPKRNEPADN